MHAQEDLYPGMSIFLLSIANTLENFWTSLSGVFRSFKPKDVVDIVVMAYIIYHAVRLVRETRAMQLVKGIVAILVVYFVADTLKMNTLGFFMQYLLSTGIFVLVVLFQPELRSALEKMGRSRLALGRFGPGQVFAEDEVHQVGDLINVIVESCMYLSARKTGALIVIERETRLGDVIGTGTIIDAAPSVPLITNLFFNKSPLHDGAVVVRGVRVYAAGCYLPLSQNMEVSRDLGTRHRAALGMSEVSDAVVVVVSEETGAVTIANESKLQRGLSEQNLKKLLEIRLLGPENKEEPEKKRSFWKVKKDEK